MKIKHIFFGIIILALLVKGSLSFVYDKEEHQKRISKKNLQIAINTCLIHIASKEIEKSKECITPLINDNPENEAIRYLYATSLLNENKLEEAKKEFEFLIKNSNNEKIIKKSKKDLNHIAEKTRLEKHDIGHYYSELDKTANWKNPKNILVFISDDFGKKNLIYEAFDMWDKSLFGTINFNYTDNPNEAQIIAKAVKKNNLQIKEAVGTTNYELIKYHNNPTTFINKAIIEIAINKSEEKLFEDEIFKGIALHEIGHALGIHSHSPNVNDAMYYSTNTYSLGKITNRDINTVRRIYGNI